MWQNVENREVKGTIQSKRERYTNLAVSIRASSINTMTQRKHSNQKQEQTKTHLYNDLKGIEMGGYEKIIS